MSNETRRPFMREAIYGKKNGSSRAKRTSPLSETFKGTKMFNMYVYVNGERMVQLDAFPLRLDTDAVDLFTDSASYSENKRVYKVVKMSTKGARKVLLDLRVPINLHEDISIYPKLMVEADKNAFFIVNLNMFSFFDKMIKDRGITPETCIGDNGLEVVDYGKSLSSPKKYKVMVDKKVVSQTLKESIIDTFDILEELASSGKMEILIHKATPALKSQDWIRNNFTLREKVDVDGKDMYPIIKDDEDWFKAMDKLHKD